MVFESKRQYLQEIRERYQQSSKKMKQPILDEFCTVCGYSRKYAIRILCGKIEPRKTKPGPKVTYDEYVVTHLVYLWESMGHVCSKKMKAAIPLWLPYYKSKDLTPEIETKLHQISPASIDRVLKPYRAQHKGLSTTKPSLWIKNKIPIELLHSKVKEPGYIEADTVAHCGNSIAGEYANTITMTDLYSGWTENRATWTKTSDNVLNKIKNIEKNLPFLIRGFACDNGTEFLNNNLYTYFTKRKKNPIKLVRRRPYKKNDAAHVEQKNFTHVRQLFGYHRIDDKQLISLMNEIYRAYWNPLHNYFIPNMKLMKKTRVGARIKKVYDDPKTPYHRLLESSSLFSGMKQRLKLHHSWLNPFTLKAELDKKIKTFNKLIYLNNKAKKWSKNYDINSKEKEIKKQIMTQL